MPIRLFTKGCLYWLLLLVTFMPLSYAATAPTPNLQVSVVDGSRNNIPLVNYDIQAREVLADGSSVWRTWGKTDANGKLAFALDGLGAGRNYILSAKSTRTTNTKQTPLITQTGSFTFKVGSPPLLLTLIDALSKKPLPAVNLNAYKQEAGKTVWVDAATTDATGVGLFEIEALQQGTPITIAAKVFNDFTANFVYTSAGAFTVPIGDTIITLQDGTKSDLPLLANYPAQVREVLTTGATNWYATVKTDSAGQLRLNLPKDKILRLEAQSTFNKSTKASANLVAATNSVFKVGTLPLMVTLKDALTTKIIPNVKIAAYQLKADGTSAWRNELATDVNGLVGFDLPELAEGGKVQLFSSPYNGYRAASVVLTQAGNTTFNVGETLVTVVDGVNASNSPLANYALQVKEILTDGKVNWYANVTTDNLGQLHLTLPEGRQFRLEAKSTVNTTIKSSPVLIKGQTTVFKVGTPLLNVTLKDALTSKPIINTKVTAYRLKADGTSVWYSELTTDANGLVNFDIPELVSGDKVQLFSTPYNGYRASSDIISQTGAVTFNVGETLASVVDGIKAGNPPLANYAVQITEILATGNKWFASATTDSAGQLHLSLPANRQFRLEAKNTVNNNYKTSANFTRGNTLLFKVGSPLLNVTLKDAITNKPIANTKVTAYRLKADGTSSWHSELTTDANGIANFDIAELSSGEKAQLYTNIYNNYRAASPIYTQAGNVDFKIGNVRVKAVDATKSPAVAYANQKVAIVEILADGKEAWRNEATTDANGQLNLTLVELNDNRTYLLKAQSTFNKAWKNSQAIKTPGDYTFTVGSQPLPVTLKDVSNNSVISNVAINAYSVAADGKLNWRGVQTTDAKGQAYFDLDELANGGTIRLQAKAFNDYAVWSSDIKSSAAFVFGVGSSQITVKDGTQLNGSSLPNLEVHVREQLADGSTVWINRGISDALGNLKIDLPGIDKGRVYYLQAQHPVTKAYKSSPLLKASGAYTFMVGTPLLSITLQNALTKAPLADKDITLYEIKAGDTSSWPYTWRTSGKTDAKGQVKLDSELLSQEGLNFVLNTTPYNTGSVFSPKFAAKTYATTFSVGAVPVILQDKDNKNSVLANVVVEAYEISADSKLIWRKKGTTDSLGQAIFDLENLRNGARHVFKAINPFATNKSFYSRIINGEGPVQFAIGRADTDQLDLVAPTIEILAPNRSAIGAYSFDLSGRAADNKALDKVEVNLVSGTLTSTQSAIVDKTTGIWTAKVNTSALQSGQNLTVTATAFDATNNSTGVSRTYQVLTDSTAPSITLKSHADNDTVLKTGFLLQGSVSDDTGVASLSVQVATDGGTVLVAPKTLSPTPAGDWAYALANGILVQDSKIIVTLTAMDAAAKQTVVKLPLNVAGAHDESRQLLSRITFGINAELLQQVSRDGLNTVLEQQLAPQTLDDSVLQNTMTLTIPLTLAELQTYTLQHMIGSRRQLLEVMTWFWDNHFNTDLRKTGDKVLYELAENDAFRANALGNFRNLLEVSAKSPAMLYYLDSVKNVKANSNENYARELMELHTVGVDGGYTQKEVETLAEVFTGWQVLGDRFYFNAAQHNSSNKIFWGNNIPAGGEDEGKRVLDILARHPATAKFICSKLITQFVSDQPLSNLQARCADTFLAQADAPDQIAQVLRVILTSPEFFDASNNNSKVKTPLEFVTASVRALQAKGTYADLPAVLKRMGMDLYQLGVPTGYSDTGDDWVSSAALQERVRFVNLLASSSTGATYVDTKALFKNRGSVTAESVASDLLNWTIGGYYADFEWQTALSVLNAEGTFDPNASNAEARLRETIGTVLSYPEFNYQ